MFGTGMDSFRLRTGPCFWSLQLPLEVTFGSSCFKLQGLLSSSLVCLGTHVATAPLTSTQRTGNKLLQLGLIVRVVGASSAALDCEVELVSNSALRVSPDIGHCAFGHGQDVHLVVLGAVGDAAAALDAGVTLAAANAVVPHLKHQHYGHEGYEQQETAAGDDGRGDGGLTFGAGVLSVFFGHCGFEEEALRGTELLRRRVVDLCC